VRVALACPYDWDAPGGVQVHIRQLAMELHQRGHEAIVLAPATSAAQPSWVRIVGRPLRVRYQGTVAPICFSRSSAGRVGRALAWFRPDVVHVHEPLSPSTSMLATLRAPAPVVATFHAHAERSALLTLAAPALRPVWRRLAVRLAVSRAAARFVGARFEGEIRIVPNGCDVDRFSAAQPVRGLPPGRRMLWVGRLDPQKGFRVAVAAFRDLAATHADLSFVVAGDGRDRDAVDALPPPVRHRVVMLGAVPHERLPGYHAASDVFVSPALGQESFGIVLVEAMAAGVPVVASDIEGYREVVRSGVDGLLVPPGRAGELAEGVRRVLADPGLAARLRDAGRGRADRFRWDRVVIDVEAAYREAMGRSGA
jgi:phosphatidylinositol alpha-mannosyltransferase